MASPSITVPPFPCYVAMRSRDTAMGDNGWIPPDIKKVIVDLPRSKTSDTDASQGPPDTSYYTPVSDFTSGVERSYGAAVSSGGPLVAGRAEHGDVQVGKDINNLTPVMFLYCSNGYALEYVHFHFVIASDKVMNMVLHNVHVASHEMTGASGDSAGSNSETFTLRYASMKVETQQLFQAEEDENPVWHNGASQGWNKSTDRAA